MTTEEARKVVEIACTADGECWDCANDLIEQLKTAFPEFPWKAWLREIML